MKDKRRLRCEERTSIQVPEGLGVRIESDGDQLTFGEFINGHPGANSISISGSSGRITVTRVKDGRQRTTNYPR